MNDPVPDIHVFKLAAAVAGAVVSLNFVRGTWTERLFFAVSGAACSYFTSSELAEWLNASKAIGTVGFFTGLFGMAIASRAYEGIEKIDAKQLVSDIWETFKRKWGA